MLTRFLRLDALGASALSLLARLYRYRRKWAAAAAVLTRLDALQPGARTKRLLADALLSDGQFEAAARVYEELAALLPDNPRILQRLARAHSRRRDWNAACLAYQRLVTRGWLRPVDRVSYGRALYEAGNSGEAEIQLQAVLRDDPDERDALTWLARIRSRNDPEQAYAYWSRLAELKPQAVEPPLQMARIRVRQRRLAEARGLFETVLALDADHEEALAGIGHALAETDRAAAIQHFTRWAARSQRNLAPRFELARLYQRAHERDLAEAIYREVLERDPHNQRALSHLAELLSRDHSRLDHALALWRQIAERDRRSPYPIVQRAVLYERVRRFEEAEAEYRRALARAPGDAGVTIGLARLLSNSGRLSEAAELFEAVTRANPRRVDALLSFGRCLEGLGREEEALAVYRRVLFVEPANPNAPLYRGRLLRRLGRLDEAIEQWQAICGRSRQNIDAWHELVFMLATAEREAEAVAALDAAEAALPATAQSAARLGVAAQAAQLHDRAVAYFERAIAADPNNAAHQAQLGQYYLRQGIVDGAFRHLLASRELKANDLPVAKQLVKTVHILNDLGIDHVALHRAAPTAGEVLVPERLFHLVRQLTDTEVERYEPVPRRIVAVSASLAAGGAERQLVTMLRGLADPAFGLDLALFCVSLDARTRRDFFLPLLADTPVEVVLPPAPGEAAPLAGEGARFGRLISHFPDDMVRPIAFWLAEFGRRRPQIVHAWQDATNLTAVAAALLAGVPRIVLAARSVRPDNPRRRLKRHMKEAYQAVLGHPSVVLSNNSRAGADDYADWLGLDPAAIEVVYNGIDFAELERTVDPAETRAARDGLAIPADAPVLGSAFRMSEEKRPLLWVEAAAAVARAAPRAHFIVCGDGPMRTEMAELAARLGIADRLHLPGPQANIASWYKAMDVVMLTSRHEGLPNVLLEAQCLGVPVVAPDVGGMRETVWQGVTGWTIRDADAAALAERVLYCFGDAGWMARARVEAPRFVKQRFDTASMLRRTFEVYRIPPAPPAKQSTVGA